IGGFEEHLLKLLLKIPMLFGFEKRLHKLACVAISAALDFCIEIGFQVIRKLNRYRAHTTHYITGRIPSTSASPDPSSFDPSPIPLAIFSPRLRRATLPWRQSRSCCRRRAGARRDRGCRSGRERFRCRAAD